MDVSVVCEVPKLVSPPGDDAAQPERRGPGTGDGQRAAAPKGSGPRAAGRHRLAGRWPSSAVPDVSAGRYGPPPCPDRHAPDVRGRRRHLHGGVAHATQGAGRGSRAAGSRPYGNCCSPGDARSARSGWRPATASGDRPRSSPSPPTCVPVQEVSRKRLDAEARSEAPQGVLARAAPLQEADLDDLVKRRSGPKGVPSSCSWTVSPTPGTSGRSCVRWTAPAEPASSSPTPGRPHHADGGQGRRRRHRTCPHRRGVGSAGRPSSALRKAGIWVVGLDDGARDSLFDLGDAATEPIAVVLGAEGSGLSRLVRERCDLLIHYPHARSPVVAQRERGGRAACYEITRRRA